MTKENQKQQIRERLLEQRTGISETLYLDHSSSICQQVKELSEFKKADAVHCYVSMNERREVNTHPLIKQMLSGPKKVVVPVMQKEEGALKHIQLNSYDELKPNDWKVPEPTGGQKVPVSQLDLVLVPMVGGDLKKIELVMAAVITTVFWRVQIVGQSVFCLSGV